MPQLLFPLHHFPDHRCRSHHVYRLAGQRFGEELRKFTTSYHFNFDITGSQLSAKWFSWSSLSLSGSHLSARQLFAYIWEYFGHLSVPLQSWAHFWTCENPDNILAFRYSSKCVQCSSVKRGCKSRSLNIPLRDNRSNCRLHPDQLERPWLDRANPKMSGLV